MKHLKDRKGAGESHFEELLSYLQENHAELEKINNIGEILDDICQKLATPTADDVSEPMRRKRQVSSTCATLAAKLAPILPKIDQSQGTIEAITAINADLNKTLQQRLLTITDPAEKQSVTKIFKLSIASNQKLITAEKNKLTSLTTQKKSIVNSQVKAGCIKCGELQPVASYDPLGSLRGFKSGTYFDAWTLYPGSGCWRAGGL